MDSDFHLATFSNSNLYKRKICTNLSEDKQIYSNGTILIFYCNGFANVLKLFWSKNPTYIDEIAVFI